MNEVEFLCKSFVEAAYSNIKGVFTPTLTIIYNDGQETDLIVDSKDEIYSKLYEILNNKTDLQKVKEIQFKANKDGKIEQVNKIDII